MEKNSRSFKASYATVIEDSVQIELNIQYACTLNLYNNETY